MLPTRNRRGVAVAALVLGAALAPRAPAAAAEAPEGVDRGCPPERAPHGEVRLAFLGDSGYGEGFSEWGAQGQDAVAARLASLRLEPDLVFFLGDNVYWHGSARLFKSRFDDVYDPLVRGCKTHVALGNHDVKGCRAVGADDLPGGATAYEDEAAGRRACNAAAALAHTPFGFGSVEKGNPATPVRQRYYSILWPLPRVTPPGKAADPAAPPARPLVDVVVLDTNTLDVGGGALGEREGRRRADQPQLLWLRNAMEQWLPAPGETHGIWKILAMHHPPYTPRACVCRMFGACFGGHGDQAGLRDQLDRALADLEPPDLVFAAHNHIYARSLPLDRSGRPVMAGTGGVRYFVTGGGGGPLFAVKKKDPRFPETFTAYHFVYLRLTAGSAFYWTIDAGGRVRDSGCFEKGSNVDHPLAPSFSYDDALPERCAAPGTGG
jgi:Calcineurin-like phosphoesterase